MQVEYTMLLQFCSAGTKPVALVAEYPAIQSNGPLPQVSNHYPETVWLSHALPSGEAPVGIGASKPSLFSKLQSHISDNRSSAFLVNLKPHYLQMDTTEAARLFHLPDLCPALGDYFSLQQSYVVRNGQRWSRPDFFLPFTQIRVWTKF